MQLAEEELKILTDTSFLQLKSQLTRKLIAHFSDIERELHTEINKAGFQYPDGTFLKSGKISKGEQYQMLPYVILDYPRLFTQKEVFAYRTMIWWGHHFSCTLHLAGPILENHKKKLLQNIQNEQDLFFCINSSPWEYHYKPNNYLKLSELSQSDLKKQIKDYGFVKISDYLPLHNWDQYKSFALKTFIRFLQYLE